MNRIPSIESRGSHRQLIIQSFLWSKWRSMQGRSSEFKLITVSILAVIDSTRRDVIIGRGWIDRCFRPFHVLSMCFPCNVLFIISDCVSPWKKKQKRRKKSSSLNGGNGWTTCSNPQRKWSHPTPARPPASHRPPTAHCTLCWCQTSSSRLFVRLIVRKKRLPGTPPNPPLLSHRLKTVNFNRFMCSVSIVGRHHIRSDVSLRRCRFSPVLSGSLRFSPASPEK